jgi:hypothetical protein
MLWLLSALTLWPLAALTLWLTTPILGSTAILPLWLFCRSLPAWLLMLRRFVPLLSTSFRGVALLGPIVSLPILVLSSVRSCVSVVHRCVILSYL